MNDIEALRTVLADEPPRMADRDGLTRLRILRDWVAAVAEAAQPAVLRRLVARLDEAEKNAARYLFLRDKAWGKLGALALLPADKMDAAVDKAIKEQS
jgi:hypothetical protein